MEVITLLPGTSTGRRDWTPQAQPPDKHGILAHTPNPRAYHLMGSRTMIPRASGPFGGSQGFSVRPGVVNIDPENPTTGTGGITVDLEAVSKSDYAKAAAASMGDPVQAWSLAAQRQRTTGATTTSQVTMSMPSAYPSGHVVPHTNFDGAAIQPQADGSWGPAQGVGGTVMPLPTVVGVPSPAAKPKQAAADPQRAPASWDQPLAAHPGQPPVPPQAYQGQPQPAMPQYPPPQYQPPQYQPPQYQPPQYQPPQHQPPMSPQPDPTNAIMLQMLQAMLVQLQEMRQTPPAAATVAAAPAWQTDSRDLAEEKRAAWEHRATVAATNSPYAKIGLPFLGAEPTHPQTTVIFHSANGAYRTRYHHAMRRGMILSLIYDNRYDGDQFLPASTVDNQTVRLQVPALQFDGEVQVVSEFNQSLGCMDIVNLIVADQAAGLQGPPIATEDTQYEIDQLVGGDYRR